MDHKSIFTVLTTINDPNSRVKDWYEITGNKVIVIGDNKTPPGWNHPNCEFHSIVEQKKSNFTLAKTIAENHYTRKNIGYLYAIENGAEVIIDTDDDNFPYVDCWRKLLLGYFSIKQIRESTESCYKNVYTYFSEKDSPFWPRGFPIDLLTSCSSIIQKSEIIDSSHSPNVALWQCMVNGDPDIDALHRLIFRKTPEFEKKDPILFSKGNLCPLNSQNTLWLKKDTFSLLYLPSTVSFRFTDILRGYVAQVILHSKDFHWGFYPATAVQERNDHNLMNDFDSEILMYQNTRKIIDILLCTVNIKDSVTDNLMNSYHALSRHNYVRDQELSNLDHWLDDLSTALNNA